MAGRPAARAGRARVQAHLVAGGGEVAHHSGAHQAGAHEADQHAATIPSAAPGGREKDEGRSDARPRCRGTLPGRPGALCPSATSLRTAARGQWERPSIRSVPEPGDPRAPRGDGQVRAEPRQRGVFGPGRPQEPACAGVGPRYPPARDHPAQRRDRGSAPPRHPIRRLGPGSPTLVIGTTRRSAADDITGVGSQFAYNAFLATVPFLFVLVSVVGLVAQPDTFDEFLADDADNAIPVELREILRSALRSPPRTPARPPSSWPSVCSPPSTCRPTSWAHWWAGSTGRATCPTGRGCAASWSP